MPAAEEVIDAYLAAWNCVVVGERRRLLTISLADGCELTAPTGTFRGLDAVDALIVALQTRMAGATIERVGPVESNGAGATTFGWRVSTASGVPLLTGTDEVTLAGDGRLSRINVAL